MRLTDSFVAPFASLILAIVAALLTIPASLAVWEQRVLIDESGFVAAGNEALSRAAVQEELSQSLADDFAAVRDPGLESSISELLRDSGPGLSSILDLIGGRRGASASASGDDRGLLSTAAGKVLAQAPNQLATNVALAATHNEVLEAIRHDVLDTEGDSVVLNLNDAVAQLLPVSGAVLPETAGQVELMRSGDISSAFDLAKFLDGRAVWLSLLPLTVFGMGFFLAPDGRRYALQAGVALLATGLVTAVFVKFVLRDQVAGGAIHEERTRDAANAVYDVFTASLVTQEILIAGAGLLIAAVAYARLRGAARTA